MSAGKIMPELSRESAREYLRQLVLFLEEAHGLHWDDRDLGRAVNADLTGWGIVREDRSGRRLPQRREP